MKRLLFIIFVILMTPIYLILGVLGLTMELILDMSEPIAEAMSELVENMTEFWEKVLKGRKSK